MLTFDSASTLFAFGSSLHGQHQCIVAQNEQMTSIPARSECYPINVIQDVPGLEGLHGVAMPKLPVSAPPEGPDIPNVINYDTVAPPTCHPDDVPPLETGDQGRHPPSAQTRSVRLGMNTQKAERIEYCAC